jgi:hypothetical protein
VVGAMIYAMSLPAMEKQKNMEKSIFYQVSSTYRLRAFLFSFLLTER